MPRLASQDDLWYNVSNKIWCVAAMLEASRDVSRYWIGVPTVDSLSPHASNGNIPAASGIYKITCAANKRFYIGSTVNLRKRWREHYNGLVRKDHGNSKLQRAFNKYGEDAFTFEVLELVLPMSLTAREQYWLDKLKPFGTRGFNMTPTAGSTLGRKFSPEAKEKIRLKALGRKRSLSAVEKTRQANLGRKQSPEIIERIRQSKIGKKRPSESVEKSRLGHLGLKHTAETRQKMSMSHVGMSRKKHTPESIEKMRQSALARNAKRK